MFIQAFQQPTNEIPVSIVVALIGAIISIVTLAVQWKKDKQKQAVEEESAVSAASNTLFDQYQEELKRCSEDRTEFRRERTEWEKERDELVKKVKALEAERFEQSLKFAELQLANKRMSLEIADLNKRLTAALEDT